ncbi:MAG: CPBP family intramembrane metalloprotease [Gammaproteobacteria bacterium]|jgi:hypothetical protein|nr:CPBP family intramembrane metalloprotease [Gammaproteobacteria bacterium]MBT3722584.1 CPBP family intramembrane metalloprotease [Gammaproteobacteria bacterium]MBT4077910.1 CPBP family intramembrane metalloprotease [Gammaproteobacteria bacterium]MBT4193204.1 CPBP family intramembrane metalloprotease [Gammaproteobacteria bacterium]MBT4451085.1 CPBP family intramembrane metalloprotease [Gammaproteobacteria bacterium]
MNKKISEAILDVLKYSVAAYIIVKILAFSYIFAHNIVEIEQWSYLRIWSAFGEEVNDYHIFLIYGPVIETIIFCVILSSILTRFFSSKWVFIVLSASMLSALHLLSEGTGYFTFMYTSSLGFLFAFIYWKYKEKYSSDIAFLITTIIHSFYNLLASIA